MKRKTAALTAFLLCMAFTGSVCSAGASRYISISELSDVMSYINGKSAESETEKMDINSDGVVNILDVILTKEHISNDLANYRHVRPRSDYESDIKDVSKLNTMAETITETVSSVIRKIKGINYFSDESLSYDDGSEISEEVNRILKDKYGYQHMKWYTKSSVSSGKTICSADGENTGAYPVKIPENIHFAPDPKFLQDMWDSSFSWEQYFKNTTELNITAKELARSIDTAVIIAVNKDAISKEKLKGEIIISSDNIISEMKPYIESYASSFGNQKAGYKWTARLYDGAVSSVVISDITLEKTGAFPYSVPQSLDVPYSDTLISYAEGEKNWKEDFEQCISSDKERSVLPDIVEMNDEEELGKAYMVYITIKSFMDANKENTSIADGEYTLSDLKKAFPNKPALALCEYEYCYEHYYITFKDNTIFSVEYENDNSGSKKLINEEIKNELEANAEKHIISSPSVSSKTIFTKPQTVQTGEYEPEPDYSLYYSTDDDDYKIICTRKEKEEQNDDGWTVVILNGK